MCPQGRWLRDTYSALYGNEMGCESFLSEGFGIFWGGVGGTRVKGRVMESMKGGERGLGREVRSLQREYFFLLCALSLTLLLPERFRKKERHIHTQKENKEERVVYRYTDSLKADIYKCVRAWIQNSYTV